MMPLKIGDKPSKKILAALLIVCVATACVDESNPRKDSFTSPAVIEKLGDATPPRYLPVTVVNHVSGVSKVLDREAIERIGISNVDVWDPALQTLMNYQGVRFSGLINSLAASQAVRVVVRTFQGERISFTLGELLETPYMLITRQDNVPLRLANKGPLRILVAQGGQLESERNKRLFPKWLWQIVRIDIYGAH